MRNDKTPSAEHNALPLRTLKTLLAALVAAFSPPVHAAAPAAPDAGSILQQIQPVLPPAPASSGKPLAIEEDGAARLPASAPFEVKAILISGNTLFDTPTLHRLVSDAEGRTLTLPELGDLAARITEHYRGHGYPLARAIVPAQTIQSGIVRIEIIEARYGRVSLENRSRVNDLLLEKTLSSLENGQPIGQTELDRALLLLSDIPGVVIAATLKPGETVGTSDLLVNAQPGPALSGAVVTDNYGNRYTGRARIGGTLSFNNPLNHGDVLSASALTSGHGLGYVRLAYDTLLNGQGTRIGGAVPAAALRPGRLALCTRCEWQRTRGQPVGEAPASAGPGRQPVRPCSARPARVERPYRCECDQNGPAPGELDREPDRGRAGCDPVERRRQHLERGLDIGTRRIR